MPFCASKTNTVRPGRIGNVLDDGQLSLGRAVTKLHVDALEGPIHIDVPSGSEAPTSSDAANRTRTCPAHMDSTLQNSNSTQQRHDMSMSVKTTTTRVRSIGTDVGGLRRQKECLPCQAAGR